MARKTRKKFAAKTGKKRKKTSAAAAEKTRKTPPARKSRRAAKKKSPVKPKGIIAKFVDEFKAVIDTLTDAERLHQKLEPRVSREPE
ncbi:MAG: hypothetical protein ACREB8_09960 [Pseudolabrys sp.]